MFFLGVLEILLEQLFHIIPYSGFFYVNGFYNLMTIFALKSNFSLFFRKTAENPVKDCNNSFLSGFSLWVLQNIFIRRFSEHCHGFAFTMTYCLQKEKGGKKIVLGGRSFDNFFLIVSLTSSPITINLWKKLNLKIVKSV